MHITFMNSPGACLREKGSAFLWAGVPVKSYFEGRRRFVLQDLFHLNMLSYTRKRLIIDLNFYHKLDYSVSGENAKHVSQKIDGVNRCCKIILRWPSNNIAVIRFPPRNMHTMEYCRQQSPSLRLPRFWTLNMCLRF